MTFPLNASTTISFGGQVHLHAWLDHKFSGESASKLSLVSRARQFSSFMVLIGRVSSATSFDPKYAALVQNKDELEIPLELSTIPTPKEFKDAIESLSSEQQEFAKAFRAMQLESTFCARSRFGAPDSRNRGRYAIIYVRMHVHFKLFGVENKPAYYSYVAYTCLHERIWT